MSRVAASAQLAIGEHRDQWRFVRDERPYLLRVLRYEGQRVHRAATAGEQVDRPGIDRRDEPMQVVRVLLDGVLRRAVGALAPLRPARVVGHDCAIGEVLRKRAEPGGAHRRPDHQKDRIGAGIVAPDVVRQDGAGDLQGSARGLGHRLGHSAPPVSWFMSRTLDVTCFSRPWPLRTAGARWAGRPGSLPPSGWTASRPVRARCPGRCRGTAVCPGRRPRGRSTD